MIAAFVSSLSLAWRNLLRNRRRSLMTLIAMVLGLVAVLLFGGYISEIKYAMRTGFVQESGHLQLQHKGYFRFGSGNPTGYGIENYEKVIAIVRSDPVLAPLLAVVTPTLQFGGIAGNFAAGVSRTVFVQGIVADEEVRLRDWNEYGLRRVVVRPSLAGSPLDSAIIGTGLARVLQLCVELKVQDCGSDGKDSQGDGATLPADISALSSLAASTTSAASNAHGVPRIEVLATSSRGAPNVSAIGIVRAAFQGVKEFDDVYVGMHLAHAQKLIFGAAPRQVTAILLQLHHTADVGVVQRRLDELLAGSLKGFPLEVLDYETLNPFYGQTMQMFNAIFSFVSVLIGGIVLFTVGNTMSMAVVERTTEIGTLRAIGVQRRGIRAMFVSEGLVLACFGSVLGIGAALVLAWGINQLGLTWVPPGRIEQVALAVHLAGENVMMASAAVGLLVVGVLSAIVPADRAARMNIVEALRHV